MDGRKYLEDLIKEVSSIEEKNLIEPRWEAKEGDEDICSASLWSRQLFTYFILKMRKPVGINVCFSLKQKKIKVAEGEINEMLRARQEIDFLTDLLDISLQEDSGIHKVCVLEMRKGFRIVRTGSKSDADGDFIIDFNEEHSEGCPFSKKDDPPSSLH